MKTSDRFALMAAGISGLSVFANSFFTGLGDPMVFAFVRNLVVASALSVYMAYARPRLRIRTDLPRLFLIGAIGGGIPFALFFLGLSITGAVWANLINKTLFIWVGLIAVPFVSERISWKVVIGYIALVTLMVFGTPISQSPIVPGLLFVLAATIFWAFEYILIHTLARDIDTGAIAWGRIVFGLPFLFGLVSMTGRPLVLAPWYTYMISGTFLIAYMMTLIRALTNHGARVARVSLFLVLAPLVTSVCTYFTKGFPTLFTGGILVAQLVVIWYIARTTGEHTYDTK